MDVLRLHGVLPDHDAVLHVPERAVRDEGADDEQPAPHDQVAGASRGDPQHHHEDPEVQQRRAEVLFQEQDGQGDAPRSQHRPEVLELGHVERPDAGPRLLQQLAALGEIRSQEHDHRDLAELRGLELERADPDPHPRAVDLLADARDDRQQQQPDGDEPQRVGVRREPAVVADAHDRRAERHDAHHHPDGLLRALARVEPVDHGEPDAHEQRGGGEDRGVGARRPPSDHEVAARVAGDEEHDVDGEVARQLAVPSQPHQHEREHGEGDGQDGQRQGRARVGPGPSPAQRHVAHGPAPFFLWARCACRIFSLMSWIAAKASARPGSVSPSEMDL